jgi:predicted nucleic acid-binding Zn ribbon protein
VNTGPRRTTPQPLRRSLEALLDDLGSAPVRETTSLLDRWPEVVGRDLAGHTEPVGVRHGVLLVQADDPAYGQALGWDERSVLARLANVLGPGIVTGLQVRIRADRG